MLLVRKQNVLRMVNELNGAIVGFDFDGVCQLSVWQDPAREPGRFSTIYKYRNINGEEVKMTADDLIPNPIILSKMKEYITKGHKVFIVTHNPTFGLPRPGCSPEDTIVKRFLRKHIGEEFSSQVDVYVSSGGKSRDIKDLGITIFYDDRTMNLDEIRGNTEGVTLFQVHPLDKDEPGKVIMYPSEV